MNLTANDLTVMLDDAALAEISDKENHQENDYQVINATIADVEGIARGYYHRAGLIGVPFDAGTIAYIKDICVYRLSGSGRGDIVKERHDEALAWFKLLMDNPDLVVQSDDDGNSVKSYVGRAKLVRG